MIYLNKVNYVLVLFFVVSTNGNEFRLGYYYQAGMVLQSGGANIWGWGAPQADVQVSEKQAGGNIDTDF